MARRDANRRDYRSYGRTRHDDKILRGGIVLHRRRHVARSQTLRSAAVNQAHARFIFYRIHAAHFLRRDVGRIFKQDDN